MQWISFLESHPTEQIFLTWDIYNPEFVTLSKFKDVSEDEEDVLIICSIIPLPCDYEVTHWMPFPAVPNPTSHCN